MKYLTTSAFILSVGLITSCSSGNKKYEGAPDSYSDCQKTDWYEVGYQNGLKGTPVSKFNHYAEECSGEDEKPNQDYYLAGRDRGLKVYCHPDRAFEAGKKGEPYLHVCPDNQHRRFLEHYEAGKLSTEPKTMRELRLENQNLKEDVKELKEQLEILKK